MDLFGFLRGTPHAGSAGAGIDFEHRITPGLAAFATGTIGHTWGPMSTGLDFNALAGMRWRW